MRRDHFGRRARGTIKYAPWEMIVAVRFSDELKANAFERRLDPGFPRAIAGRHFRSAR